MIKTKEEVVRHFKELFNLPEFDDKTEGSGFFANGKFYVHKNNFSREYVVDELVAYFSENVIESQLVCDHPDEAIIKDKPTDYCLACNRNI